MTEDKQTGAKVALDGEILMDYKYYVYKCESFFVFRHYPLSAILSDFIYFIKTRYKIERNGNHKAVFSPGSNPQGKNIITAVLQYYNQKQLEKSYFLKYPIFTIVGGFANYLEQLYSFERKDKK